METDVRRMTNAELIDEYAELLKQQLEICKELGFRVSCERLGAIAEEIERRLNNLT